MSDTETEDIDQGRVMMALGHAIMQWAAVELHLVLLFRSLVGAPHEVGDLLWGRVRSFEAKLQMLNDLAEVNLPNAGSKRDWTLLREYISVLYRKRNQLAHSTATFQDDGSLALEPFLNLSQPSSVKLRKPEVDAYAAEFMELAGAITEFHLQVQAALRHQESRELESDLIQYLRTKADQKREAQRHRSLAWRQYLDRNPDLKIE
jgi:hypothetical protein